jgi:hypothetical protein
MAKYGALAAISAFLLLSGATLLLSTTSNASNLRGARRLPQTDCEATGGTWMESGYCLPAGVKVEFSGPQMGGHLVLELCMGVLFYAMVASKYPKVQKATAGSKSVLEESPCCRIEPGAKCMLSFCCPSAMLAHVMDSAGGLNYWIALFLGSCQLTASWFLCYAYMCSDVLSNLGAKKDSKKSLHGCCEAMFCGCCVIHQMVDAMDEATEVETQCCGIKEYGAGSGSGSE